MTMQSLINKQKGENLLGTKLLSKTEKKKDLRPSKNMPPKDRNMIMNS
jgi:hypothetical protein